MVMGVVENRTHSEKYPGLRGARVLLSGLESGHGVDIARAFADAGCRLVLQTPAMTSVLDVLLEDLSQSAEDVRISAEPITDETAALKFAQSAASAYGGLEAVINLARLDDQDISSEAGPEDVQRRVHDALGPMFRITHVVANRMQLTWTEGLVLNIVTQGRPTTPAAGILGSIARSALAGITRTEAGRWAGKGIRINAIVPSQAHDSASNGSRGLASEPEIAALALHLAGSRGHALSGLVFDAAGAGCIDACPLD